MIDIIEYMATSDNVLNAAFAPRFETRRHLPTFVDMLTYTPRGPSHWSLPCEVYPQSKMQLTRSYNPPLKEFVVLHTSLRSEKGEEEILKAVTGPMIGLVTQGSCTLRATAGSGCQEIALDMGCIIYVAPGTELRARLIDEESEGQAEIWWAASVGK